MQLTPANWIEIIAAMLTGLSVCVAVLANARTLRQNNRFKRAEWLMNTTLQFHRDERLSKIFDEIQYERFAFNSAEGADTDLHSQKEMELVYWLDFLNSISDAVDEGLLTIVHLRSCTLGYAIDKTLENKCIQAYLSHVAAYDLGRKSGLVSWGLLRRRDHESFTYLRKMKKRYKDYEKRMRGRRDLDE